MEDKETVDLSQYSIRTDLAVEAREMVLAEKSKDTEKASRCHE